MALPPRHLPCTARSARGGAAASNGDAGEPAELSDSEIAAVIFAANLSEIEQAQLALQRGDEEEVRYFAEKMLKEHSAAQERQEALFAALGIVPRQNALSTSVREESHRIVTELNTRRGDAFDLAYMNAQVRVHSRVLDLLEKRLIPNAESAVLREELETTRSSVQAHLTEARILRDELDRDIDLDERDVDERDRVGPGAPF